jgi:hypothetical protein
MMSAGDAVRLAINLYVAGSCGPPWLQNSLRSTTQLCKAALHTYLEHNTDMIQLRNLFNLW